MALEHLQNIGKARDSVKTMADTEAGKFVQEWASKTVELMRENAPSASGTLKSSLGFSFEANGHIITINFLADDYWDYLNSGVDGVERSAGAITNQYGTTYSFKTINPSPKMVDAFKGSGKQNWMASKGITASDGNYDSLAYILARSTKRHGIEPSEFVNDALTEEKLKAFEEGLLNAFEKLI